ncbi:hypothetical protein ACJX0J_021584, partial [Zea mays]
AYFRPVTLADIEIWEGDHLDGVFHGCYGLHASMEPFLQLGIMGLNYCAICFLTFKLFICFLKLVDGTQMIFIGYLATS